MGAGEIALDRPGARAQRPYAPSWIHHVDDAVARLPGPTWLVYLGFGLVVGAVTQVQAWQSGEAEAGTLSVPSIYWTFLAASLPWAAGHLRRLAATSADAFRPVLARSDEDAARFRYELSTMPAVPSLVFVILAAAVTLVGFVVAPADAGVLGVSGPVVVASFLVQIPLVAILFAVAHQLLRQMRLIGGAMADARIDLFRPGPLNALSRVTAQGAAILVFLVGISVVVVPQSADVQTFVVGSAPYIVLPPVVALVAFLVPLSGVHGRLDREKDRLLDDVDRRMQRVLGEIDRDVDSLELGRADGLNKLLASVIQQRDVVGHLSTWPWSTGTIRGFVSAILLPLFLFVIQLLLSRTIA